MGGNPVVAKIDSNEPANVLAQVASHSAPPKAGSRHWHYRKLALIFGGSCIVLGGGAYGYKWFTAKPASANAQPEAQAVASAPTPEPTWTEPPSIKDDSPIELPPVRPVKAELPEVPTIPEVTAGPIKPPADSDKSTKATTFGADKTETGIAPILPPTTGDG